MVRRSRFDRPLPDINNNIHSYQTMENVVDYKGSRIEYLSYHMENIRARYLERLYEDKARLGCKPLWEVDMRRLRSHQHMMKEHDKANLQRSRVKLEKIQRDESKSKKGKKKMKLEKEGTTYDYPNLRWVDGITTERKAKDGKGILREVYPHMERMLEDSRREQQQQQQQQQDLKIKKKKR